MVAPWWSGQRHRIWWAVPLRTCKPSCISYHPDPLLKKKDCCHSVAALILFCSQFVDSCKLNIESGRLWDANIWQSFGQNCTGPTRTGGQPCIRIVSKTEKVRLYQNCIRIVSSLSGIVQRSRKGAERLDLEKPWTITNFRSISDPDDNIWSWWQYLIPMTIFYPFSAIFVDNFW